MNKLNQKCWFFVYAGASDAQLQNDQYVIARTSRFCDFLRPPQKFLVPHTRAIYFWRLCIAVKPRYFFNGAPKNSAFGVSNRGEWFSSLRVFTHFALPNELNEFCPCDLS